MDEGISCPSGGCCLVILLEFLDSGHHLLAEICMQQSHAAVQAHLTLGLHTAQHSSHCCCAIVAVLGHKEGTVFVLTNNAALCLICKKIVSTLKDCNLKGHCAEMCCQIQCISKTAL